MNIFGYNNNVLSSREEVNNQPPDPKNIKNNKITKIICISLCATTFIMFFVLMFYTTYLDRNKQNVSTDNPNEISKFVAYNTLPSVMEIVSGNTSSTTGSAGTGFVIYSEFGSTFIVTNRHVIEDNIELGGSNTFKVSQGAYFTVKSSDLIYNHTASLVAVCSSYDIAILQINTLINYKPLTLKRERPVYGEYAMALGNALGNGIITTSGIVTSPNFVINDMGVDYDIIQTDAAINHGNSGGPLVNKDSEVIGLVYAGKSMSNYDEYAEKIGYCIPMSYVIDFINDSSLGFTV